MEIIGLLISCILSFTIMLIVSKIENKNQLQKIFLSDAFITFSECLSLLIFGFLYARGSKAANIFMAIAYIGIITLPVTFLFTGIIFAKTKITLKKRYVLILIIPIISIIIMLTNNYHHLFVIKNSDKLNEIEFGKYFNIHNIYTDILYLCAMYYFIKYTIKNSGFFSKQAALIAIGCAIPLGVNILGTFGIVPMSIYTTPMCFSITIILYALAIFKFQFLGVAPIALQKIVDRISDGYVVLNDNNNITDFNKTFIDMFKIKNEKIRGINFIEFLKKHKADKINIPKLENAIEKAQHSEKTISYEQKFEEIKKYFTIEIASISSDNSALGTLVMFKDITQHKEDMETIKNNQDVLMERERLAGLGQLIGGIAHNLKTSIMSIAGATQGLENLIKEYDESIDDPLVNSQDHHDIAKDMEAWIPKIRAHLEYMSDIITTVKGQAVASLSTDDSEEFTISELVKRVNILMKHELKNAYIYLNILMKVDEEKVIDGNVNILVQVINNIISNAIQAYDGKHDQNIQFEISQKENNMIFSITDFAGGLSKEVQDRLFKEMVTTKGKNGTGLGLYMSYSNIKAHFGGDITYKTEEGKGTTFNIVIPIKK